MQNSKSEAPVIFSKEGFTIIEILVVVVIIGILASIVVVSFNTTLRHSREGKRIADLKNVSTALDMYYAENNSYPNSYGGVGIWDGIYSCWGDSTTNWIPGLVPTYLKGELPRDPRNHTNCGEQYIYRSDGKAYKLLAHQPEDCQWTVGKYPSLADPMRNCWAFGYYSEGAYNF